MLVAIVSVPENVPQEPADHPILFLQALGISTHVIEIFRLWPGMSVDVEDFAVRGSLADLGITVRGLSVLQAIASKNIGRGHNPSAPSAGLFLEILSESCSVTARGLPRGNADLHHMINVLMIWILFIETQPLHEPRLRLALGKGFDYRSHGVLTLHALVP